MKISWTFTHPQAIQDIDEFVSLSQKILRNEALYHLLTSEWVPSEWVQTADKNNTIIHTTLVHQLASCELKKLHDLKNKTKTQIDH